MESNFKLIDGAFSVEEAKEVLGNLLEFKIQFHNKENLVVKLEMGLEMSNLFRV